MSKCGVRASNARLMIVRLLLLAKIVAKMGRLNYSHASENSKSIPLQPPGVGRLGEIAVPALGSVWGCVRYELHLGGVARAGEWHSRRTASRHQRDGASPQHGETRRIQPDCAEFPRIAERLRIGCRGGAMSPPFTGEHVGSSLRCSSPLPRIRRNRLWAQHAAPQGMRLKPTISRRPCSCRPCRHRDRARPHRT